MVGSMSTLSEAEAEGAGAPLGTAAADSGFDIFPRALPPT